MTLGVGMLIHTYNPNSLRRVAAGGPRIQSQSGKKVRETLSEQFTKTSIRGVTQVVENLPTYQHTKQIGFNPRYWGNKTEYVEKPEIHIERVENIGRNFLSPVM
jgi:hypothetical protein